MSEAAGRHLIHQTQSGFRGKPEPVIRPITDTRSRDIDPGTSAPGETGSVVFIAPAPVARRYPRSGIAYRPVSDLPESTLALAWPQDARSPAVAAFVRAHGSIKEMEQVFGVSYPTIKARLNRISEHLEFVETDPAPAKRDVIDRLVARLG